MAIDTTKKHILVIGATGQQGGGVVRHLLARGWQVSALTRQPDKPAAQALAAQGVHLVQGELDDRASIDRALEGMYGVFSVQTWGGTEEGITDQIRQGKALADAVRTSDVQHLVHSSVEGADRQSSIPHFENQWVVEHHIHALDLPYTILRPVFFMENFTMFFRQSISSGVISMDMPPNVSLQMIAVEDIGAFAALAFESPEQFLGKTLKIAGDERSMLEVAAILTRHLGWPIRYENNPHMWEGDSFLQREFRTMFHWYNTHGYQADIVEARRIYPSLLTLEQWLHKTGWGKSQEGQA